MARELVELLLACGHSLRTIAAEMPCGKSALANYASGRRAVPPQVVAALVPLVGRVVPAIPGPLRRSLVILGYDLGPLTPIFRWDTVVLEVPRPEEWLGSVPSGMYDLTTADVARLRVEHFLDDTLGWRRKNATIQGDNGRRHVHRAEMGDIRPRYSLAEHALHPMERGRRRLRVWADPFGGKATYWPSTLGRTNPLTLARTSPR